MSQNCRRSKSLQNLTPELTSEFVTLNLHPKYIANYDANSNLGVWEQNLSPRVTQNGPTFHISLADAPPRLQWLPGVPEEKKLSRASEPGPISLIFGWLIVHRF